MARDINELITATTNLLSEVAGQKERLTIAVDSAATGSALAQQKAQEALFSANTAQTQASRSTTEAERAKREADRASQVSGLDTVEEAVDNALARDGLTAMTKEDFFALAEKRKRDSAGSGFLEWGKQPNNETTINQGLWEDATVPSTLYWGSSSSNRTGSSRTDFPTSLVNGVQHRVDTSSIKFPLAPNATKTYASSTGVVVDFTKDIDPKYSNVASDTKEAIARAFEGMVVNGDFRLGAVGWVQDTADNGPIVFGGEGVTISVDSAKVDNRVYQNFTATGTFKFSTVVRGIVGTAGNISYYVSETNNKRFDFVIPASGTLTIEETLTTTSGEQWAGSLRVVGQGSSLTFSNCTMQPIDNSVITTRKDFCFLETWHEAIDEHDLWNPLGNVQFSANSFDGIVLSDTLIAQSYSAFDKWDTTTKGYGKYWSTMTVAEKTVAIQNSENNIYFDAKTGRYIQVKYRIRVIEGVGDKSTQLHIGNYYAGYYPKLNGKTINPQGSGLTPLSGEEGGVSFIGPNKDLGQFSYAKEQDNGYIWWGHKGSTVNRAYDGILCALPTCLGQRLNQGAYHPIHNSEGCSQLEDDKYWYNSTFKPTSTKDCFTHTVNGAIASGKSGRPITDPYKFYDAIYAGQVEDLRLSANKQVYSRLLEDGIHRAVAGKTRGRGKVPSTIINESYEIIAHSINNSTTRLVFRCSDFERAYILGSQNEINGLPLWIGKKGTPQFYQAYFINVTKGNEPQYVYIDKLFDASWLNTATDTLILVNSLEESPPEYDSLPWVDIIGSPENIAVTFPNGVVGKWIPQQGGSNSWSLGRKSNTGSAEVVETSDNGSTWIVSYSTVGDALNDVKVDLDTSTEIAIVSYSSLSNFTAPADNSVVVGGVGDVYTTDDYRVDWGNRLMPSLTSFVGKSGSTPSMSTLSTQESVVQEWLLLSDPKFKVAHTPVPLPAPQNSSPAVKTLYNLTSKNGLLYIQYHGNELKYKANAAAGKDKWGNTTPATPLSSPYGTIPIISGEGTMTNLNGEIVKTFCHTEMIPFGIADFTEAATTTNTREVNFFSLVNVPAEMRVHYVEDDGTLTRSPFYFENGGHIDDAEVARYELFQEQHEAYIQANYEEYESRTPEILI